MEEAQAIYHPNRQPAEAKTTKAIVVLLLLVSAGMVMLIMIGGWSAMQGAQPFALLYAAVNVLFAYYVSRWNRGLLTVAAALAIFYGVLALIAAPSWFARDKEGLADPLLAPALLGLLCFVLVAIQALLVLFCARGFSQRWNVEIEVDPDDPRAEPLPRGHSHSPLGA